MGFYPRGYELRNEICWSVSQKRSLCNSPAQRVSSAPRLLSRVRGCVSGWVDGQLEAIVVQRFFGGPQNKWLSHCIFFPMIFLSATFHYVYLGVSFLTFQRPECTYLISPFPCFGDQERQSPSTCLCELRRVLTWGLTWGFAAGYSCETLPYALPK